MRREQVAHEDEVLDVAEVVADHAVQVVDLLHPGHVRAAHLCSLSGSVLLVGRSIVGVSVTSMRAEFAFCKKGPANVKLLQNGVLRAAPGGLGSDAGGRLAAARSSRESRMGVGAEALTVRLFPCRRQQRATTTPSGRVWIVIVAVCSEPTSWARAVCPASAPRRRRALPGSRRAGCRRRRGRRKRRRSSGRRPAPPRDSPESAAAGPAPSRRSGSRRRARRRRARPRRRAAELPSRRHVERRLRRGPRCGTISGRCYFTVVVKLLPTVCPP